MAPTPLDEDSYPDPLVSGGQSTQGLWRVLVLAVVLIAGAVAFSLLGDRIPQDLMLLVLGLLAMVGVFCLFALAAGLIRISGSDEVRTLARSIVDTLPYGAVATDRDGKIVYANAQYGAFPGALGQGVPVGVPRLFAG